MSAADVLKQIQEKEVRFIDFRFTDSKGKEQHVTVPAHDLDEEAFEEGKMFDGSSISGWKGINESDMILMPDAESAVIDPFFEDMTMNIRCDVVEPATMQATTAARARWRAAPRPTCRAPASPIPRCSARRTNSSCSTT